jgi:hypothetical protein
MKRVFFIFAGIGFSILNCAAGQTNGFLVIEIDRDAYSTYSGRSHSDMTQDFKIPLTDEFFSNFKNGPILKQSMGTGFLCRGGDLKTNNGSTSFAWWIHRKTDHRWYINMWAGGAENVNGRELGSGNPSCSQEIVINKLDDLWMRYMLGFENYPKGLSVSFTARFETAKEMQSEKPMLIPPVKKADGAMLFIGDDQSSGGIYLDCLFQED